MPSASIVDSVRAIFFNVTSAVYRDSNAENGLMRLSDSRWIAYWYISIAIGFVLLAIYNAMIGGKAWLIGIRLIIAAGFAFLGWMDLRAKKRQRR